MTNQAAEASKPPSSASGPIVAKAGQYYRVTRYIMTVVLLVYGGWSIYDGFFSWPNWSQTHPNEKPKTGADILFNQVLGITLPPLGVLALVRALYNSRGEYRLENRIVHIPGHPPVPLDRVQAVNRQKWDRKGIAYVEYDLGSGKDSQGTFTLDDFVYERPPTDEIFKQIEAALLATLSTPKPKAPPTPSKLPPRPKFGANL